MTVLETLRQLAIERPSLMPVSDLYDPDDHVWVYVRNNNKPDLECLVATPADLDYYYAPCDSAREVGQLIWFLLRKSDASALL